MGLIQNHDCPGCGHEFAGLDRWGPCPACGRTHGASSGGVGIRTLWHYSATARLVIVALVVVSIAWLVATVFTGSTTRVLLAAGMTFIVLGAIVALYRIDRGLESRRTLGQCMRCAYDMRGLESPVCPECGSSN